MTIMAETAIIVLTRKPVSPVLRKRPPEFTQQVKISGSSPV
jgi:hypothetical protein